MTIVVIGCSGAGKSLLLKKLTSWSKSASSTTRKNEIRSSRSMPVDLDGSIEENSAAALYESNVDIPPTNPTIGTNFCNVRLSKNQQNVALKEIGGSMAPLWKSSYKDATKLIYMVDLSNPMQVSMTASFLNEIVNSKDLQSIPILIVLNKIDNYCALSSFEMKYLIGLESILQTRKEITVVEASVKYDTGISVIVKWISDASG